MAHIFNRRTYLTHYKAVIGEQVGKSALINKFITGNFISEHVPTTTGMQSLIPLFNIFLQSMRNFLPILHTTLHTPYLPL